MTHRDLDPWAGARESMVADQIAIRGVKDPVVLDEIKDGLKGAGFTK